MFAKKHIKQKLWLEEQNKILNDDSPFYVKEAYKTLRTNIMFSLPMSGCKIIAVTSSLASEGKSTNSANLAVAFAQTNAKVLLIDCDLRKPDVARLFGKTSRVGLSNVLVNLATIEETVLSTNQPNLKIMCSGDIPPNPSELLNSDRMKEVLDTLSETYDYIILDTPPVNLVTDTSVLSKYVSGIVLVVRANSTKKDELANAIRQLQFTDTKKILGFILNGNPLEKHYGKYRYKKTAYHYE